MRPARETCSTPSSTVASAQPMLVPLQAPLRTSTTASNSSEPSTRTVSAAAVAVNLYHTSSSASPVKVLHEIAARLFVAPDVVPGTGLQVAPTARVMAPAQLSFTGAPPRNRAGWAWRWDFGSPPEWRRILFSPGPAARSGPALRAIGLRSMSCFVRCAVASKATKAKAATATLIAYGLIMNVGVEASKLADMPAPGRTAGRNLSTGLSDATPPVGA